MSWSAIVEMLGCMEAPQTTTEAEAMTVLERQQARLKWQQQQQSTTTTTTVTSNCVPAQDHHEFTAATLFQTTNGQCREDHQGNFLGEGMDANVWPDLVQYPMLGSDSSSLNGFASGTSNMGAAEEEKVAAQMDAPAARQGAEYGQVCSSLMTKEGHGNGTTIISKSNYARKKRKVANHEAVVESNVSKRMKGEPDGRAMPLQQEARTHTTIINKSTKNNEETSADGSKDASKASEVVQKPDYIHVRARRGQATDSHSLAERVRREKISERMKYLQELVPGCDRITGKAGMLDEIINYVQSLQRQVEFLSMKLATVNPVFDFDLDGFLTGNENIPAFLSFNLMQHSVDANCGLDMPIDLSQAAVCRTASAPLPVSETLAANTCFDIHAAPHSWDTELQDLQNVQFHHGKAPFQDVLGANHLKMET